MEQQGETTRGFGTVFFKWAAGYARRYDVSYQVTVANISGSIPFNVDIISDVVAISMMKHLSL